MLAPPVYPSFERAYIDVLRHLSQDYEFKNAPRGNASRECLGLSFQLSDPEPGPPSSMRGRSTRSTTSPRRRGISAGVVTSP